MNQHLYQLRAAIDRLAKIIESLDDVIITTRDFTERPFDDAVDQTRAAALTALNAGYAEADRLANEIVKGAK